MKNAGRRSRRLSPAVVESELCAILADPQNSEPCGMKVDNLGSCIGKKRPGVPFKDLTGTALREFLWARPNLFRLLRDGRLVQLVTAEQLAAAGPASRKRKEPPPPMAGDDAAAAAQASPAAAAAPHPSVIVEELCAVLAECDIKIEQLASRMANRRPNIPFRDLIGTSLRSFLEAHPYLFRVTDTGNAARVRLVQSQSTETPSRKRKEPPSSAPAAGQDAKQGTAAAADLARLEAAASALLNTCSVRGMPVSQLSRQLDPATVKAVNKQGLSLTDFLLARPAIFALTRDNIEGKGKQWRARMVQPERVAVPVGSRESAATLSALRAIAEEIFERGFGLQGRAMEDRNDLAQEASQRTGCRFATVKEVFHQGLFEELDPLRRLLRPGQQVNQHGRMVGFQYDDMSPVGSDSASTAAAAAEPSNAKTEDSSSSSAVALHFDLVLDSRKAANGAGTEYCVQLCNGDGDVVDTVWLPETRVRDRRDLIDAYHAHSAAMADSDSDCEELVMFSKNKKRRRIADSDEEQEQEQEMDEEDQPIVAAKASTPEKESSSSRKKAKSETGVAAPAPAAAEPAVWPRPPSANFLRAAAERAEEMLTEHQLRQEAEAAATKAKDAAAASSKTPAFSATGSKKKSVANAQASLEILVAEAAAGKKALAVALEQAKQAKKAAKKQKGDEAAAARAAQEKAAEEEARQKHKAEKARRREEEAAEAAAAAEAEKRAAKEARKREKAAAEEAATAAAEKQRKLDEKARKAEEKERAARKAAEDAKADERQRRAEDRARRAAEAEAAEAAAAKAAEAAEAAEAEAKKRKAEEQAKAKAKEVAARALAEAEARARVEAEAKAKAQAKAEAKAAKAKAEADAKAAAAEQKRKEQEVAAKKALAEAAAAEALKREAEKKRREAKAAERAAAAAQVKPEPNATPVPSPAASAPLKDSLAEHLGQAAKRPRYIVIDAADIAHWQGSGAVGSMPLPGARAGGAAVPCARRFSSWQVAAAVKAVEQQVSGLGIQVVTWLGEQYLRSPSAYSVHDVWVLLELQRQGKLHLMPAGADGAHEMLRLAQMEDTYLVSNNDLTEYVVDGALTPQWRDAHLCKFFTFALPFTQPCANCTHMRSFWSSHYFVDEAAAGALALRPGAAAPKLNDINRQQWKRDADRCCLSCMGSVFLVQPTAARKGAQAAAAAASASPSTPHTPARAAPTAHSATSGRKPRPPRKRTSRQSS